MTLQDFVRDSLLQISQGVAAARNQNIKIAPYATAAESKKDATFVTLDGSIAFLVEFDVAVTISEKTGGGISGGISVAGVFKAQGQHDGGSEHSSISRLRFSVPIVFTGLSE